MAVVEVEDSGAFMPLLGPPMPKISKIEKESRSLFEFLLDDSLLDKHLEACEKNRYEEPSPSQLIIGFLESSGVTSSPPEFVLKAKAERFVRLALRVVSSWNWRLDWIETRLPFSIQRAVFVGLITVGVKALLVPVAGFDLDKVDSVEAMAYILYSRWVARGLVRSSSFKTVKKRLGETLSPALMWNKEQIVSCLKPLIDDSIRILNQASCLSKSLPLPLFMATGVSQTKLLPIEQLQYEAAYDLAELHVFHGNSSAASALFSHCKALSSVVPCESIDFPALTGYLTMFSLSNQKGEGMVEKLATIQKNNYNRVVDLLKKDLVKQELSHQSRLEVEERLGRQAATASSAGSARMYSEVCLCNGIASVIDGRLAPPSLWSQFEKRSDSQKIDLATFLCQVCSTLLDEVSPEVRMALKSLVWEVCFRLKSKKVVAFVLHSKMALLFSEQERDCIEMSWKGAIKLVDTGIVDIQTSDSMLRQWESHLASILSELSLASHPREINLLISKLETVAAQHGKQNDVDEILNKHFVYHPYTSLHHLFPDTHIRRVCSLFHFKAQKYIDVECYESGVEMLRAARDTVFGLPIAILDMTEQQLLLAEILQSKATDYRKINPALLKRVRGFIQESAQPGSLAKPELVQAVAICLLNARDWNFLLDQRHLQTEAWYHLVACSKFLTQPPDNPAYCERAAAALWEAISSAFSSSVVVDHEKQKREGGGKNSFVSFVLKIKEGTALNIAISCLANLYNVMSRGRDGSIGASLLSAPLLSLWPSSVLNFERIRMSKVSSSLSTILDHGLKTSGAHAFWLLTKAELLFVSQQYKAALKTYIEAGAAVSGFFEKPVSTEIWRPEVYRRLIQICNSLEYHIQAAVICQCVSPVDHSTAVKSIQLAIGREAVEVFHPFFWNVPILENIIHLHAKRGEHEKRQSAVTAISQPELNSCNAPEILDRAILSRKSKFFQLMADRFLT